MRAVEVQLHVAEAVDPEHRAPDPGGADLGLRQVEARQGVGRDRWAELRELDSKGKMCGGRGEEIASVERARDRLERVLRVHELVRLGDPAELLRGRDQQAVVGPHVQPTLTIAQRQRAARAPDPGIDDGEVYAGRHERQRVRERQRALENSLRCDAVRDVDDLRVRGDAFHHTVAGADEVVLQSEIRQERNEARHAAAESTRPCTSCDSASATISTPAACAAAVVSGPIEAAGPRPPARA